MRTLVNDALAGKSSGSRRLKQSYYEQACARAQAERETVNLRHERETGLTALQYRLGPCQQPQQSQQAVSPLDDPESALSKLKSIGVTRDDYMVVLQSVNTTSQTQS